MTLLAELVAKGHRTLIFSQSRVMLDILQAGITEQSYPFRRIDGSISSAADRQVSAATACSADSWHSPAHVPLITAPRESQL